MGKVHALAQEFVTLYESPDPKRIWSGTPGLARLPGGRLAATLDFFGPGLKETSDGHPYGKVFLSDDHGVTWRHTVDFPFYHARPFTAGDSLYVLGHAGDLMVIRSRDRGETWSAPVRLTQGQDWHQSACNVHEEYGCVYLVMERRITRDVIHWHIGEMAPVLMRGRADSDLTRRENWTFASELSFRDALPGADGDPAIDFFGVPFFPCPYPDGSYPAPERNCAPMGWLETNVVRFTDPSHYWHDPTGRTFHLWARAHTGGTGYAAIAKVVERGDRPGTGGMETMLETVPSGKKILFVPCPGGQMKFHVIWDAPSGLFWLLSTQATDSMRRADLLPPDRYNLPNNERRRLVLHFSRNMVDWCFAGLVAMGPVEKASRHYASMVADGEDLHILSRSGNERAFSAHNGNLTTFHTVRGFRELAY